jgi:hypothetical protein
MSQPVAFRITVYGEPDAESVAVAVKDVLDESVALGLGPSVIVAVPLSTVIVTTDPTAVSVPTDQESLDEANSVVFSETLSAIRSPSEVFRPICTSRTARSEIEKLSEAPVTCVSRCKAMSKMVYESAV